MIVIICLCGAGCLGALTTALVFYRKLVPEAELEKHWRKLIGLVIVLAVGVCDARASTSIVVYTQESSEELPHEHPDRGRCFTTDKVKAWR